MINVSNAALEQAAVDVKQLASNFADIAAGCDCSLDGATLASQMALRFPMVDWGLNTAMARTARNASTGADGRLNLNFFSKDANGKWNMKVPGNVWTLPQTSPDTECCWEPFDFDKCCGEVPLNLLCLKDCDSMADIMMYDTLRITRGEAVRGISNVGERVSTVNRRIADLSFAFYLNYTASLGMDGVYTDILKPFHGVLDVMNNPAIMTIAATSILTAFEELDCYMFAGEMSGDYRFFMHPLILRSVERAVRPNQSGELPTGWSRSGGALRFNGIPLVGDKTIPMDPVTGYGEIWLLEGNSFGIFLVRDLYNPYRRESGLDTSIDNCGTECRYEYNMGAAFNNNSDKLAKIINVPIDRVCMGVIGGMDSLLRPKTLIPKRGA